MRVLVVKTSSLGDLIHTFPAVTDAARALPGIEFHWLSETGFAEVPAWHPAVSRVISIDWRRWRGQLYKNFKNGNLQRFKQQLQQDQYDLVIDAQGLLKSAVPAWLAKGEVAGFDRHSARESIASRFYRHRYPVAKQQHAIARVRQLFASALNYQLPETEPDFSITLEQESIAVESPYLLFLHATTWPSKHWPKSYWAELCHLAVKAGYRVYFPWHSPDDRLQAERIMKLAGAGQLLARMGLTDLAGWLKAATGVVGVDSGLAHIAAALGTPAITLYGPTEVGLTGATGSGQQNMAAQFPCAPCMQRECKLPQPREPNPPCFGTLSASLVWGKIQLQIKEASV